MKYISDYVLGEKFSPKCVRRSVKNNENWVALFHGAECYVSAIRATKTSFFIDISLLKDFVNKDKNKTYEKGERIVTLEYTIFNYIPEIVHMLPTCVDVQDIIIDDFAHSFFEIDSILAEYDNETGMANITYFLKLSTPIFSMSNTNVETRENENIIYVTEEKLKFLMDNNLVKHIPWDNKDNKIEMREETVITTDTEEQSNKVAANNSNTNEMDNTEDNTEIDNMTETVATEDTTE